jgi:hypothetical protein
MMDFRDELDEFFDKYGWVLLLVATLYFVGHGIWFLIRRFLYV